MQQFGRRLQLTLILALTLLAYSNIFSNGFVWDDRFFILDWEKIRSWGNFWDLIKGELPEGFNGAFRPLLGVFYLIFYQLFGTNPLGWHIQSILVHLINTILVYLIITHLQGEKMRLHLGGGMAFAAALLFGIHPVHTEAVTFIAASINSWGYLFFFLSFLFYLRGNRRDRRIRVIRDKVCSIIFATLAFFTYEFTLTLPLLVLLYEFCFRKTQKNSENQRTRVSDNLKVRSSGILSHSELFRKTYPFFILAGAYVFIRVFIIHILGRGPILAGFWLTQLAMLKVYLKYITLLILPINQSIIHTLPGGILSSIYIDLNKETALNQSFLDPLVIIIIIFIIFIIIIMVIARKKAPLVSFSIGWFLISLLPASNIIPVQELMAERYLYIPSLGFILLLSHLSNLRNLRYLVLILAIFYGYLTYQRNTIWFSNLTLWTDTVQKSPTSALAHYNLGKSFGDLNEIEKAEAEYKKAIEANRSYVKPYNNLGALYTRTGRFDLAQQYYLKALEINPHFSQGYYNLGTAYMKQGQVEKGIKAYLKALEINPGYVKVHGNLGVAYFELGNIELARKHFEEALRLDPGYTPARINLENINE